MTSHIAELRQAVRNLNAAPFLRGSTNNQISDLHADLTELDGYINGLLQQVLAGKAPSHPLQTDPVLRAKIIRLMDDESGTVREHAEQLLMYLNKLDHVIHLAKDAMSSPKEN